jgi:hypothetical protein
MCGVTAPPLAPERPYPRVAPSKINQPEGAIDLCIQFRNLEEVMAGINWRPPLQWPVPPHELPAGSGDLREIIDGIEKHKLQQGWTTHSCP